MAVYRNSTQRKVPHCWRVSNTMQSRSRPSLNIDEFPLIKTLKRPDEETEDEIRSNNI